MSNTGTSVSVMVNLPGKGIAPGLCHAGLGGASALVQLDLLAKPRHVEILSIQVYRLVEDNAVEGCVGSSSLRHDDKLLRGNRHNRVRQQIKRFFFVRP